MCGPNPGAFKCSTCTFVCSLFIFFYMFMFVHTLTMPGTINKDAFAGCYYDKSFYNFQDSMYEFKTNFIYDVYI